ELSVSVLNVALNRQPTGATRGWRGDAVAIAKRDLAAGEMLDGEGGYTVYGKLVPAARSLAGGALPVRPAHGGKPVNPVPVGQIGKTTDVTLDENQLAVRIRREMETRFRTAE